MSKIKLGSKIWLNILPASELDDEEGYRHTGTLLDLCPYGLEIDLDPPASGVSVYPWHRVDSFGPEDR